MLEGRGHGVGDLRLGVRGVLDVTGINLACKFLGVSAQNWQVLVNATTVMSVEALELLHWLL